MPKQAQLKKNNEDIFLNIYKIGDIYITTNSENPADRFGGTWELFGPGRCLVCVDTSQAEFNSVKKTGGEKSHKLTINEMPNHNHSTPTTLRYESTSSWWIGGTGGTTIAVDDKATGSTGGSQAHNNLQPYITCYMWKRVG